MPKTKSINHSATDLPPPLVGAFQSASVCSSTHLRQVASCSAYARRASATVRQPYGGFVMKRLHATISFGDAGVHRPAALCPASTTADSAISRTIPAAAGLAAAAVVGTRGDHWPRTSDAVLRGGCDDERGTVVEEPGGLRSLLHGELGATGAIQPCSPPPIDLLE